MRSLLGIDPGLLATVTGGCKKGRAPQPQAQAQAQPPPAQPQLAQAQPTRRKWDVAVNVARGAGASMDGGGDDSLSA